MKKRKKKEKKYIRKHIIMCGLVMLVHAWGGLANEMESHTSSERVQAG